MPFPTSLTSYTITSGGESPNSAGGGMGLSPMLNAFQSDITGLGTKLGTGASTPANNTFLIGNGAGTSAWSTLTSAQLAARMSDETGTGSLVFGTSPTIVTPTVASFANAQHTHADAAGGGKLTSAGITSLDMSQTTMSNPYKFLAYRNAAYTTDGTGYFEFDAEAYDTNNNFDITTNKGRYTAPVNGYYKFDSNLTYSVASPGIALINTLYKNGAAYIDGGTWVSTYNSSFSEATRGAFPPIYLAAGDYVQIRGLASTVFVVGSGSMATWFGGYLVSHA